jgi:catechol 2,3-dioxygenase-like lactoylglutathione lyase family enzyme
MLFQQVKFTSADPTSLATFYESALGCRTVLANTELDETAAAAIGVPGFTVSITILSLPWRDDAGPTLELISFGAGMPEGSPFRPGQGQIAFLVDDVTESVESVLSGGGSMFGEVRKWTAPSGNNVEFVFMRDPEGNVIDLFARV